RRIVEIDLADNRDALEILPPFPSKTIGKIKGKALDHRRDQLEAYIVALLQQACFNSVTLVDAMCAFLEVETKHNASLVFISFVPHTDDTDFSSQHHHDDQFVLYRKDYMMLLGRKTTDYTAFLNTNSAMSS